MKKIKKTEIYLISPNNIEYRNFAKDFKKIASLKIITYFQLRLKNSNIETIANLINFIFPICKKHKIKFIINDEPKIAKKFNLDGVHVGKNDPSIHECRQILGKNKIIGKSCYSSNFLANKSQILGANYVAFGSFFQTKTKIGTSKILIPNIISWNKKKSIPSVGIGGINYRNFFKISMLNLDFIALSSAIWNSKSRPDLSLKKVKNLIDNF